MTTGSKSCQEVNLDVLLDGDEDSDLYRRAAGHVESCPECQRRLTELSGDAEHWSVQREMLRPVSGDRPESGLHCRYRSAEFAPWRRHAIDESTVKEMLAAPSHPEMLGRLGRYEIERIIGTGGMGIVLKGFDSDLNRPVAIKLLAPHLARVGAARQRFAREARAAAAVVHEHVVPIHNVESEHAVPFLVMQFIPGESLQARVEREGPLNVAEILRIGMQAAAGLAAAHAQGLVHRDVKPANILLENGVERAFLTDFGLARASDDASLTYTGVVAGTPHYMSPEQADGQPLDHRSDLFSLGSVLYFMATGHPPFRADRPMAVLKRTCHDPHRPAWQCNAEIPDALSDIIDRLLEKKPGQRFASAAELQSALAAVLADVQLGKIGRRHKPCWRLRFWMIVAGLVTIVAIGVGVLSLLRPPAANENSQRTGAPPSNVQTIGDQAQATQSAANALNAADPSPSTAAQSELDSLSGMLDALEATPFPESQFNTQPSPPKDSAGEAKRDAGPTSPDEKTAEPTDRSAAWRMNFRSAPWNDMLDWYVTIAELPIHADEFPDGTLNYADEELHSLDSVTNILRVVLRTKGILLKRQPGGIQLIRVPTAEAGNLLGVKLPTHDELAGHCNCIVKMKNRIAELNKQRDTVPDDAKDRDTQLGVIKAQTDSLRAEHVTALAILEAEAAEVQLAVDDADELSQQVTAINAKSADCIPGHTVMALQRERLAAQATLDEIHAILDVGRIIASAPTKF
jgi:serine/threonine protein kinase